MRATLTIPFIRTRAVPHAVVAAWLFRVGIGMCFIGHGAFGVITKEAWLPYFGLVGIGPGMAYTLMPVVGVMDITIGIIGLLSPRRVVLAYMTGWTVWTAALRPLAGESIWELVERAGNFGVPLAFLLAVGIGAGRLWFTRVQTGDLGQRDAPPVLTVLKATTVLLLLGHGMLALTGANGIVAGHLAAIGLPPDLAPVLGGFEVGLAVAATFYTTPSFLIGIAAWKVATEMLFVLAGSPGWEVIERGGSYTAPLILAVLLTGQHATTRPVNDVSSVQRG